MSGFYSPALPEDLAALAAAGLPGDVAVAGVLTPVHLAAEPAP
ncbi:hypothetical protein [Paractinoplanes brasiliensis]|uniref:Uncharacterized protein n=1 Tax=Paractinoplanes brasiliensis TaxID=52695 RepID=A0A4R6J9Z0_9ACTN|nr:hypothetical protein [Actinoplanes brasiliensis]TDO32439.1 hypothetical protein C8E87_7900 [Actinoplanes brasiliensis]GID27689.1 hypothetical protein Abr02nite_26720 [Actinoplanes brasiliensis]